MIYEEDVKEIAGQAVDLLIANLQLYGIVMTGDQGDSIYDGIVTRLEHIAGYPEYRSHL